MQLSGAQNARTTVGSLLLRQANLLREAPAAVLICGVPAPWLSQATLGKGRDTSSSLKSLRQQVLRPKSGSSRGKATSRVSAPGIKFKTKLGRELYHPVPV